MADRCTRVPRLAPVAAGVAFVAIVAFLVRIANWPQVFSGGRILFLEGDAMYHMRRVFAALACGMRVPEFDPWLNFPAGLHCNWPPLFDLLLAWTGRLLGGATPSAGLVEAIGAAAPPVLGALTVWPVFAIARRYLAPGPSLVAALLLALAPFHVQLSVLGRPDHHVAAVLLFCLLLLSELRAGDAAPPGALLLAAAVTGLLLYLNLMVWPGSLIVVPILLAHDAALLFRLRGDARRLDAQTLRASGAYLLAMALTAHYVRSSWWGQTGRFTWQALSHLHVIVLGLCVAAPLALRPAILVGSRRGRRCLAVAGLAISAAGAAAVVAGLARSAALPAGLDRWLLKTDPVMRCVVESMPITPRALGEDFSFLIVFSPVALAALVRCSAREGRPDRGALLAAAFAVTGGLTLLQERFADMFSVVVALLNASLLAGLCGVARRWAGPFRGRRALSAAVSVALIAAAFWPVGAWLASYRASAGRAGRQDLYELCDWLRVHTPEEPGYEKADRPPAYGILAEWPLGHPLTCLARRANVANGFVGWEENAEQTLLPYRFLVARNPDEACRLMDRYRARYVVVTEPIRSGLLARAMDVLGLRSDAFFRTTRTPRGTTRVALPAATETMAVRLYVSDAAGLPEFRRVFASTTARMTDGRPMGVFKVFEYRGWRGD
jgi:dolichyl-diphosphooligosaccharide--protein glycosyltransferase